MLGLGLGLTSVAVLRGPTGPAIALDSDTIAEDASVGDLVGNLSVVNGSGTYAFTLTDDAGGLFALDGTDDTLLEVAGALDYETATTHSVTVEADNGVDDPISREFTIRVSNVQEETLAPLTLSNDTLEEGAAEDTLVGSLQNTTAGSTLTLTDSAGGRFKLSGSNIVAGTTSTDFESETTHNITVRETHPDADNSPNDTPLVINITDVDEDGDGGMNPVQRAMSAGMPFFVMGPGVTPDDTQPAEWRAGAAWGFHDDSWPDAPEGNPNMLADTWVTTSEWYMDGYYFLKPYDMRNDFGALGVSISDAVGGGMRYVWLVSSDHDGGTFTYQYGGGIHAGWSDDPGILPVRFRKIVDDTVNFADPRVDGNHVQIETPWLVYDSLEDRINLYCHGNTISDGDHGQETCLLTTTDFVTFTPVQVAMITGVPESELPVGYVGPHGGGSGSYSGPGPGGHTGYCQIVRIDDDEWVAWGLGSNGSHNFNYLGYYESTDGVEFTLMKGDLANDIGSRSFSVMRSPAVIIDGDRWTVSSEDARTAGEGQFATFVPVEFEGDLSANASADRVRLTDSLVGTYPGITYQAAVSGFPEDGIYMVYRTRGFFPDNGYVELDKIGFVYDQALAAEAAPMGVRVSCAGGTVTISWDAIEVTGASYNVYVSDSDDPEDTYTLLDNVAVYEYQHVAGDLDELRYYRVVKEHASTEYGERRVATWVSSGTRLCNQHMTRVAIEGGDTTTVDLVWLEAVIDYLDDHDLTSQLVQWTDPRFGVDADGSIYSAGQIKVFDLAATINSLNRGDLQAASTGLSRDANLFGTGKAGIASAATSNQASWSGHMFNNIRQFEGISLFAAYSRATSQTHEICFVTTGGDNNYVRLGRKSGTPGNVYMRVNEGTPVEVSVPHAVSQTNNTLIGIFDGAEVWLFENGNESSHSACTATNCLNGKTGVDVNDLPAMSVGCEASKYRQTTGQFLSNNNKFRFNFMSVGVFKGALDDTQAGALHTLLDGEMA